jgi:hypothetical protein
MFAVLKYIRQAVVLSLLGYTVMQAFLRSSFSLFRPRHPDMPNLLTATTTELQELLASHKLRSVDLVEKCLEQIDKHDAYLKAVISKTPRSVLLATAKDLDDERSAGRVRGPLHGIPVLIKVRDFRIFLEKIPI